VRPALAAVAAALLLPIPAAFASAAPTRMQVVAKEYYFILSRRTVPAGPAVVQLVNFGQDAHDLRLEHNGGGHVYGTPVVQPDNYADIRLTLAPGTYTIWCSIANHRELGMQAEFVVRRGH
jgi:plastocyanin